MTTPPNHQTSRLNDYKFPTTPASPSTPPSPLPPKRQFTPMPISRSNSAPVSLNADREITKTPEPASEPSSSKPTLVYKISVVSMKVTDANGNVTNYTPTHVGHSVPTNATAEKKKDE